MEKAHETRLALVERDMDEMKRAVTAISRSFEEISSTIQEISKTLSEFAVVTHMQAESAKTFDRLFDEVSRVKTAQERIREDIKEIQIILPGLTEKSGWIVTAAGIVLGLVIAGLVGLLIVRQGVAP